MSEDCKSWTLRLLCLALTVIATGCTTPVILQQRVVEVEKIVLKDAAGNVRFEVAVKEDGSLVQTLRDKNGNERIALMVDAEGVTRQRFFDENGKTRMGSYVYPADHPKAPGWVGTDMLNKDGKVALRYFIDNERVTRHTLYDENGASRVMSYVFPADHPQAAGIVGTDILNKDGKVALESYIDSERVTRQRLFDEKGTSRVSSYVYPADHPKLAGIVGTDILNKDGKVALESYIDSERVVRQRFSDEKGKTRMGSYVYPADHPKAPESVGTEWNSNSDGGAWMRIRTSKEGGAYHEFMDKDNKERFSLNLFNSGRVNQLFSDRTGKERISLNVYPDGLANQLFSDAAGVTRSITYTNQNGYAGFDLWDSKGNSRFQTMTLPNGKVAQSFMDRDKTVKASTTVTNDGEVAHYVEKGALETIWDNRGWIMLGIEALRSYNSK